MIFIMSHQNQYIILLEEVGILLEMRLINLIMMLTTIITKIIILIVYISNNQNGKKKLG